MRAKTRDFLTHWANTFLIFVLFGISFSLLVLSIHITYRDQTTFFEWFGLAFAAASFFTGGMRRL